MVCCSWRKPKMSHEDHQAWRLRMLNYWKDRLEERLAGVTASIEKLEEHIARDKKDPPEGESLDSSDGSSQ
tara:strand:+ start:1889 stop:2101 length:213 start_codon:yes stop_codon:yes gene_type:complete